MIRCRVFIYNGGEVGISMYSRVREMLSFLLCFLYFCVVVVVENCASFRGGVEGAGDWLGSGRKQVMSYGDNEF